MIRTAFFISLLISVIFSQSCSNHNSRLLVGGDKGLSSFEFNIGNGELTSVAQYDAGPNPSYFCYSKKKNLLYASNEVMKFNGAAGGGLTTLKLNEDGTSEKKNEMIIPYGGGCFISMSPDSGFLFIANYPKGSVVVVKLDNEGIPQTVTDSILYIPDPPGDSHAHMILNDPSGKKIYVSDLGLDRMIIYDFDRNEGKLHPADTLSVPQGFGPRHFVFSSDGSKLYLICELGSKMIVFDIKQPEGPKLIQTLTTFREGFEGKNYCADIHISKDGKYIYGSNRGENTIVTYFINPDGTLKLAGHTSCGGNWPRNFVIDPSGKFLLVGNQKSDSIAVFKLNNTTGLPVEPAKRIASLAPTCLKFY